MGVSGQRHAPVSLSQGKLDFSHYKSGWVVPKAGLDSRGKSHPHGDFDPRIVEPVTSRYTG
jgi:hypothetical protein